MSMSESESGSSDNETWPKKPKIEDPITDEQAPLEATEEAALKAIIWDSCWYILELCKKLSDRLYLSLLNGVTILVYLLYDKDDLYRMGHSRMVYDQQNRFWDELEQFVNLLGNTLTREPVYEACKWIIRTKIDRDRYSLLNECDLAAILMSAIDDDIQKAIRKAKLCPRLTVDQYTLLLIEMVRDHSKKCQDFLLAKAVEMIDIEALYRLDVDSLDDLIGPYRECSVHEEFDLLLKCHLMRIVIDKKLMVERQAKTSVLPFVTLFNIEFLKGPSSQDVFDLSKVVEYRRMAEGSPSSVDVFDLSEVAELRRKAEGSRFINRDHLLWALDEIGFGLCTAFKDELASTMAAEDHPPYHIYATALTLAKAGLLETGLLWLPSLPVVMASARSGTGHMAERTEQKSETPRTALQCYLTKKQLTIAVGAASASPELHHRCRSFACHRGTRTSFRQGCHGATARRNP